MKKTYRNSRIVQFDSSSNYAKNVLNTTGKPTDIVLQIEPVEHKEYNFIAEVISIQEYESVNNLIQKLEELKNEVDRLTLNIKKMEEI